MHCYNYSGAPYIVWTPCEGEVFYIERCPHFRGKFYKAGHNQILTLVFLIVILLYVAYHAVCCLAAKKIATCHEPMTRVSLQEVMSMECYSPEKVARRANQLDILHPRIMPTCISNPKPLIATTLQSTGECQVQEMHSLENVILPDSMHSKSIIHGRCIAPIMATPTSMVRDKYVRELAMEYGPNMNCNYRS